MWKKQLKKEGKTVKSVDGRKDNSSLENIADDKMPLGNTDKSENEANLPKTGSIPTKLYIVAGLGLLALGFCFRKQIIK